MLNRSARSLFNQETFTARREGRDAPIPDLPALTGNVDVPTLSSLSLQAIATVRIAPTAAIPEPAAVRFALIRNR